MTGAVRFIAARTGFRVSQVEQSLDFFKIETGAIGISPLPTLTATRLRFSEPIKELP